MHRLLVALLAAIDAAVAAAVTVGAVLAPLTLLWIFTFGADADWQALWPATVRVWQLGMLAPLELALGDEFLAAVSLPQDAASFAVSLSPLAFAGFTVLFAAHSGRRAVSAGAWITGVTGGVATTAIIALIVLSTSGNPVAAVHGAPAVLGPALLYAAGALGGVLVEAWREGDGGPIDRLHDVLDGLPVPWREVAALAVRGAAIVVVGLLGAAGVALALSVLFRGGAMIALFEAAHVDGLGAAALTLAHLAYLPTALVWAAAWIAGPGFAVGTGTTVSPAGADVGVVPALPLFGLLPEDGAAPLLLVVLVPVALGALAGWVTRARFVAELDAAAAEEGGRGPRAPEPALPRLVLAVGIAVLSGAAAAALAAAASGAMGPGRLAEVGPEPGAVALAVGLEAMLGAGILLLGPRAERGHRAGQPAWEDEDEDEDEDEVAETR
ncbi:DUF6350 family protein [Microbacterium sp. Marseille-Q6965]|uniref:cell division protein PerM n=1 Tax=Microbacterium sp. Marseille-Q6965 TaxID=2965072 RepID=UPI0021B7CC34|nr:DUF6350 family protein [Microbacterium sp. Marseille-Q6965]